MFGGIDEKILLVVIPAVTAAITALVVAAVTYFQQGRAAKLARRTERLKDQLQNLYGPLTFLLTENEYLLHVAERKGGDETRAEAARSQIKSNNDSIRDIIKSNYAYMDTREVAVFTRFVMDCQYRAFVDAPLADKVAPLHRSQMLDVVGSRFAELSGELTALTHGWLTRQVRDRTWVRLEETDPTKPT